MDLLHKVWDFASKAHGDQRRKFTGEPYIAHLERVKDILSSYTSDQSLLAAAVLHDIIEDTSVTRDSLLRFLAANTSVDTAEAIVKLVVDLTDVYVPEQYPSLNRRMRKSREARRLAQVSAGAQSIKYADIIDNVSDIASQTNEFALVYTRECRAFLQVMVRGDQALYQRALRTVDEAMMSYWTRVNVKAL